MEIAVLLFETGRLTLGQGARLAGMTQPDFQHLLGKRQIPLHYDIEDFGKDVETLRDLGIM